MSGHSKWANIKHTKEAADAKRGQLFTKFTREIIVAVREGGSNPEANFRLRLVIQKARDSNMPMDNIDRAIAKGGGTGEGSSLAELVLEGYGPGGAAILVQALSDNRNRTVQEIRNLFTRAGSNLAAAGSVAWLFDSVGLINVKTDSKNTDDLELMAIDAGAEDVTVDKGYMEIRTKPDKLEWVRKSLEAQKVTVESAQIAMVPKTTISLDEKASLQTLKLLDRLEELDEVQHVTANVDFSDEVLEKYQSGVPV